MNSSIHPSSLVDPLASLGKNVKIGPFCVIGPHVRLGDDCLVHSNVVFDGHVIVGKGNIFFPFSSIGAPPQDISYKGEVTEVIIGDQNIFREYVSIHRATLKGKRITRLGNRNFLMAYTHVGHDVVMGDDCIVANSTNFGGHVRIGNNVILGGGCNIAQFVTLGKGCYLGGGSAIDKDIPPFCTAYGNRVRLKGPNVVGMKRQGYSRLAISQVVDFYRDMEASPLGPRAFVNRQEEEQNHLHEQTRNLHLEHDIIKELRNSIKKSEIGVAPFFTA